MRVAFRPTRPSPFPPARFAWPSSLLEAGDRRHAAGDPRFAPAATQETRRLQQRLHRGGQSFPPGDARRRETADAGRMNEHGPSMPRAPAAQPGPAQKAVRGPRPRTQTANPAPIVPPGPRRPSLAPTMQQRQQQAPSFAFELLSPGDARNARNDARRPAQPSTWLNSNPPRSACPILLPEWSAKRLKIISSSLRPWGPPPVSSVSSDECCLALAASPHSFLWSVLKIFRPARASPNRPLRRPSRARTRPPS